MTLYKNTSLCHSGTTFQKQDPKKLFYTFFIFSLRIYLQFNVSVYSWSCALLCNEHTRDDDDRFVLYQNFWTMGLLDLASQLRSTRFQCKMFSTNIRLELSGIVANFKFSFHMKQVLKNNSTLFFLHY